MDHCVPFALLAIDLIFVNAVVFTRRHLLMLIGLSVVYLMVNMIATKVSPPAPYPFMSWDSVVTWTVIPLGIILGVLIFYAAIEWLNNKKLRYLGYNDILDVVQGKKA